MVTGPVAYMAEGKTSIIVASIGAVAVLGAALVNTLLKQDDKTKTESHAALPGAQLAQQSDEGRNSSTSEGAGDESRGSRNVVIVNGAQSAATIVNGSLTVAERQECSRHITRERKKISRKNGDISASYPEFKVECAGGSLERLNKLIVAAVNQQLPKRSDESDVIGCQVDCRESYVSLDLASIACYADTLVMGAAHGDQDTQVINVELGGDTAERFGLGEVIVAGAWANKKLEELLVGALLEQDADPEFISTNRPGLVKELSSHFTLSSDGLVYHVGKYIAGPGAEGVREVTVPYGRLQGVLKRSGPQRHILEKSE
jgi:hypothetical protein